ncbi:MAG: hypothetical protein HY319_25895 [Armatimonadetes bacterium]|nr:hypothetical protein [Armatimonadota bacterium]
MVIAALGSFSLAALIGLYLLSLVLRERETPKGVAIIHGLMAATGILLLVIYIVGPGPDPVASLVLFVMAALGGAYMLVRDLSGHKPPKWMALGHGLTAVSGYVFLLLHALGILTF